MSDIPNDITKLSFEKALTELEEIVEKYHKTLDLVTIELREKEKQLEKKQEVFQLYKKWSKRALKY